MERSAFCVSPSAFFIVVVVVAVVVVVTHFVDVLLKQHIAPGSGNEILCIPIRLLTAVIDQVLQ